MRWLKGIGMALAALLLVAVGAFVLSRWLGPTDQQERALAVMAEREPSPGRNAFVGAWLMPYRIPAGQREAVMARDVQAYAARGDVDPEADPATYSPAFVSTAHGRFADVRESKEQWPEMCSDDSVQCLHDVAAHPNDYAHWQARHRDLIARAALDGFGHYSNPFALRLDRPIPSLGLPLKIRRTSHALDFIEGRRQAAFDGVCRDIATWRRLGANSGSLLASMVAIASIDASARLFAHMLARSPAGLPLPVSCKTALTPPTAQELSLCQAMQGEFAFVRTGIDLPASLTYQPRMTDARSAVALAQACSPAMEQAIALDLPLPPPVSHSRWGFECIGNVAGCILTNIAAPAYRVYMQRLQDHGARLRLLATLHWLHTDADAGRPLAERLANRPAALRSPRRPVEIVEDGGALRIAAPSGEHRQLPLNPALR